ncbi:hypothetical protein [Bacillus cereus]|uniref:hypothetical protein n=1 Tax=Bacillus cereus TaxID=1396 RepID=UPI000BF4FDA0|nr:hypothetical protein [Bacillus cereus]PFB20605.1 hypothetical protein CN408_11505 [Bacillus cereus]
MKLTSIRHTFLEWLTKLRGTVIFLALAYLVLCIMIAQLSKITPFYIVLENYVWLKGVFTDIQKVFNAQKIIDMFKYVLPLTLTVYIFSYREKKLIAPSSINGISESIKLNLFLGLAIPTYVYGVFIKGQVDIREYSIFLIDIWWVSVVLSSLLLGLVLLQAFNNINVTQMSHITIKQLEKEINDLKDVINTSDNPSDRVYKLIIEKEKRIHAQIESVYQILGYMNKNNMNQMFIENLKALKIPITKFNNDVFLKVQEGNYIDRKKIEVMERVYNTFCVNHISIIPTLFNENKISKAKLALEIYVNHLKPGLENQALNTRFNMSLNELILNYKMEDMQKVRILLRVLKDLDRGKIEKIYENLMRIIIETQNIKVLCNIVYPITQRVEIFERSTKKDPSSVMLQFIKFSIVQKDIHLIMKSILKSIELGHHACTGFLIKFLVTRYEDYQIKRAIESFNSVSANLVLDFTEDEQRTAEQTSEQNVGFHFNTDTFDYCFHKMCILLYGQQKYSVKKQLKSDGDDDRDIEYMDIVAVLNDCNHIEYIVKKIENRESSYGLLFIKNNKFMWSLKNELKRMGNISV